MCLTDLGLHTKATMFFEGLFIYIVCNLTSQDVVMFS